MVNRQTLYSGVKIIIFLFAKTYDNAWFIEESTIVIVLQLVSQGEVVSQRGSLP
jgi:hypothetical protein